MQRTLTSWCTSANAPLFAGPDQPAHRSFGIRDVRVGDGRVPVIAQNLATTPFATLVGFARADTAGQPSVLVVPPLSGHFAILLRDLVVGLLPDFRVLVLDWTNVRHVPVRHGRFGFDDNIATVTGMWEPVPTSGHGRPVMVYGATIRDRGTGSTKVRAGRSVR